MLEIARSGKRPLIVYFHVGWCGYCKCLNREFLADRDVDDVISDYLRVKINPEDGDEEKKIAKKHGAKGYPTFLVTYPHLGQATRVHPFVKDEMWSKEKFVEEIGKIIGAVTPRAGE